MLDQSGLVVRAAVAGEAGGDGLAVRVGEDDPPPDGGVGGGEVGEVAGLVGGDGAEAAEAAGLEARTPLAASALLYVALALDVGGD